MNIAGNLLDKFYFPMFCILGKPDLFECQQTDLGFEEICIAKQKKKKKATLLLQVARYVIIYIN